MIEVREAREEDRESTIRVLWKSFEATKSFEDVMKQDWIKEWHQPDKRDWAYVAVDDDSVVANLCFFITEDNIIRGRPVSFSGVWAVATEPHYRRKGLVRDMFAKAFPKMRDEGAVLSILDPFYRPFYEQFGYALAEKRAKHIIKKEHLRSVKPPPGITYREAKSEDDVDIIINIEKSMSRFGSRFFLMKKHVEKTVKEGNFIILEKDSEPVGTVKFWFTKAGEHGWNMTIGHTRYKNDEALLGIMSVVRNYITNVSKITWFTDRHVPLRHFFADISESESQMIGSKMMRVIDFEGYCQAIAIPDTAIEDVIIDLDDEECPWNTGMYTLTPQKGKLEVLRGKTKPDIKLSALQLSKVISGASPATLLREFQEIECNKETAEKLESIFPEDNFISYQRF
ncbi:MAG: GNAT family N-acetyltransferase [Candidatus Thorarchaeota archaeon]